MPVLKNSGDHQFCLAVIGFLLIATSIVISNLSTKLGPELMEPSRRLILADRAAYDEIGLPSEMHRDQFATHCMSCHSPRLVLSQPKFAKKKWGEIAQKMITVYGAPIPKSDVPLIVEYLSAAQASR